MMRLTIPQYYEMSEAGVLDQFGKTELIEGEISIMNSQFVPHMEAKLAIFRGIDAAMRESGSQFALGMEASAELGSNNAPQPDIFVWTGEPSEKGIPFGALLLVIEVADTTARRDLGKKLRLYAKHKVPEYWVAVLRSKQIERFSLPQGEAYLQQDSFAFGEEVRSLTLPGVSLPAGYLHA
jgi:Uma2 family endonuclease